MREALQPVGEIEASCTRRVREENVELVRTKSPTDSKAFAKAQQVIQADMHEPDRDSEGRIK